MKKTYLVGAVIFSVLLAGCFHIKQAEISSTANSTIATKQREYEYACYQAPIQVKNILNPLLDREGWLNTNDEDVRVCLDTHSADKRALVITNNCHPVEGSDLENSSAPCNTAGLLLVDLQTKTMKTILSEPITDKIYGTHPIGDIVTWTPTTVTYKANPVFPDTECTNEFLKSTFAYEHRTITIATGQIRPVKTCWQISCDDLSEVECDIQP